MINYEKNWDMSTFTFCLEEKLHFDIFITRWSKEDKNKRHPVEFYAAEIAEHYNWSLNKNYDEKSGNPIDKKKKNNRIFLLARNFLLLKMS